MIRTICIHAFRPGTGKTHLIANTAVQMAVRGKRVAVVDADLKAPGMHLLFNLPPGYIRCTLNDYLRGQRQLDEVVYPVGGGFDPDNRRKIVLDGDVFLVPACSRLDAIALVKQEGYDLDLLHQSFPRLVIDLNLDYVFVDTRPGLNAQQELLTAASANLLLLALSADRQHVQGTALLLDSLSRLSEPDTYLVVNKSLGTAETEDLRRIKERFGLSVAARLPLSVDLMRPGSGGIYVLKHPDDPWSEGINRLVDFILGKSP